MTSGLIIFNDGAAYERYMGAWSRPAGEMFLDWLALPTALDWLDVGCGNGAFTALVAERAAPRCLCGIDPSEAQLDYARARLSSTNAQIQVGNAMALPFPENAFDVAIMPLVIFFVLEPALGVAEMTRVVRPGGTVAAYAWDMEGGGFPYAPLQAALRASGMDVPVPPSPESSRMDVMQTLWTEAGLVHVKTRAIAVHRTFASFDDYWDTVQGGPSVGRQLASLAPADGARMRETMQKHLPAPDAEGRITLHAFANAVTGVVPQAS